MFIRLLASFLVLITTTAPLLAQWEWVHSSVGSSNFARVTDVAIDSVRDDIYSVGYVTGNPNFTEISNASYSGGDDGFVIKYNLAGTVEWAFAIGGTSNDRINGVAVDQTTGNIFVTGFIEGSSVSHSTSLVGALTGSSGDVTGAIGNQDAFVAAYGVFGQLIWYKIIGGTDFDRGMDITVNANGVFVTGFYTNTATLSSLTSIIPSIGEINNFVIALDPNNGNTLWDAVLGSADDDYTIPFLNSKIKRMGISADQNGLYVVAYFRGAVYNIYNSSDVLAATIVDPNSSAEDYVVTSYTNNGTHNWSVLYDNDGLGVGTLDITNDCEGVYVSGVLHNGGLTPGGTVIASNHDNFLLSKLNKATGSELWLKEFQSNYNHDDYFIGINADGYGNIYAVGRLRGTSVSLGTNLNYTAGQSHSEVIIAHFLSDGAFQSFEVIPSSNYSFGMSVATYKNQKYVVGGYYNSTITFGSNVPNGSFDNAFVATRDLGVPLSYSSALGNNIFCQSEANPIPTSNLPVGGTFSGPPQLVFVDASTGEIDLASSTLGGAYTITYTGFASYCTPVTAEFQIYIVAGTDPTFTYGTDHFCTNEPNPSPTFIAAPGGTFTASAGLVVSSAGEINVSTSTIGGPYSLVYTTSGGSCSSSDTIQVYIDGAPDPNFGYSTSSYCGGTGSTSPTFTVTGGGFFSAPAGIVFVDNLTGEIDLNASASGGPYSIQYLVSNSYCQDSTTFDITILQSEDATFNYATNHLCVNQPNVSATSTVNPGVFSITSALIITNASTGEIDASASPSGGPYKLYYTTSSGTCPGTDSLDIYIEAAPDPSFSYAQSSYCAGSGTILPSSIAVPGGTFSAPAGLVFLNTTTGVIDINSSVIGTTFTIKYLVSNAYCQDSSTFDLTIVPNEIAFFAYGTDHFCNNEADPTPTITSPGGTFTSPVGLDVNVSTGVIDVSTSTVGGPYSVVYTTSGVCPSSETVQVYIEAAPDPSFAYAQVAYCDESGTILPSSIAVSGGTFSVPAGIVLVNAMTGEIDIDASTVGGPYSVQYLVSNSYCQDSTTFSLTINPLDDASFTYSGSHFCNNEANPIPISITTPGGMFTAPTGLVINASTGEIDVVTSTVGASYDLVYTTNGANCPMSDTLEVYIEAAPDPSFAYAQTTYCDESGTISPSFIAVSGGTFSGPAEIDFENTTTGEIDINASTVGGPYTIQYVVSNAYCQDSTTFSLTINPTDDASFTYSGNHFCNNEANPTPISITSPGGTFTSPAGLDVNISTGVIDVSTSTIGGPYSVVYTTSGVCPSSETIQVYTEAAPDPSFAYAQTTYCNESGTILPSFIAVSGGTFSVPAGIVLVNAMTGEIDINASTVGGPYTIQYLVSNSYCQKSTTFDISILEEDHITSVDYSASEYCTADGNQIPEITGFIGGTFSGPASIDFVNTTTGEFSPSSSINGGPYLIKYLTSGACPDSVELFLTIFETPTAYAGEDQELFFILSSSLEADIPSVGNGVWSTLSTSLIADELDPNSGISNLSPGENIIVWTVFNGVCQKASDEIIIQVQDLFIPQAITPNDDGKNDFFELYSIDEVICSVQIFNRWGQIVYENSDYQNEWFGQNMSGKQLENDTYFYVILIDDSISYNGYVVLKKK